MHYSRAGLRGAVTAPHHLAAQSGCRVLQDGGNAIEAMVAMAATIAVVYPHMNGIGGDGFWLIRDADGDIRGIEACGRAARRATVDFYRDANCADIPPRGPLAALTAPGAVGGWQQALATLPRDGKRLPLKRLLADAVALGRHGVVVTENQSACTAEKLDDLTGVPGFAEIYAREGGAPKPLSVLRQPALADTLLRLSETGLDDFYRGELARTHADFCADQGSPLALEDFVGAGALRVAPLRLTIRGADLYNMPPPTQGVSSLMILGIYERLGVGEAESFDHVHGLVEATKRAFALRNRELGDPDYMSEPATEWLNAARLDALARDIDMSVASRWPEPPADGGTVWLGAADADGTVVSYIQSVYWEFGSGLCCPQTGVVFQNRGAGFSLQPGPNQLAPGKRPFHTLNPALARFEDGRVLAYGNMGGEGQPQTQAAVFTRYGLYGASLQAAITAPRWLLGRTWGDSSTNLKVEPRFAESLIDRLRSAGHPVELVQPYSDLMGHAGGVVSHPDGVLECASDPRCDGAAVAL